MSAEESSPRLVELHVHLEGAFTAPRALDLLARAPHLPSPPAGGIQLADGRPWSAATSTAERAGARWRFQDLGEFLRLFGWSTHLLRDPDAYRQLLEDLLDSLQEQGVTYAEVFVALGQMMKSEVSPKSILPVLAETARERAAQGGPSVWFIADATRQWGVPACERVLDQALDLQQHRIVGFGMGGDERAVRAQNFREIYRRAARAGLGLSCHAGEGTTADAVREVVEELEVRRVGHGIAAAADEQLMRELAQEDVLLEVCPTSNERTGVWDSSQPHPLLRLAAAGVPVCLGSDDPAWFDCTLASEHERVGQWGVSEETLSQWNETARAHSFRVDSAQA